MTDTARGRIIEIELRSLRAPAAVMLGAAAALPVLGQPGVACPLRSLTGIPCPLCGMSTSVEATVRGDFIDAAAANPMGIAVAALALWTIVGVRRQTRLDIPQVAVWVILAAMWIFQLFRFSIL